MADRQYECIVFGASGYTGKYTAEHIASSLPTDFKWAVAGRSEGKLRSLVDQLKSLNPDRTQPGIETAELKKDQLIGLAKKTKVLISTVGPYHKYGTLVVEACAETGTHYLDCTGEVPWVYDMINAYDETAKRTGAIMIPQNGIESAPSDLMCFALASHIRRTLGVGIAEVVQTTYDMKAAPSGGTLSTVLTIFDTYSLSHLAKSGRPLSLCPITPTSKPAGRPLLETITGVRTVSDLGTLTDSLQSAADIPIVNRTWGLMHRGDFYGPKFHLTCYARTRNALTGLGVHVLMTLGFLAILLPPVRWLLQRFVVQPGLGPSKDDAKNDYVEWRAVAHADTDIDEPGVPKRAYGRMRFEGSMYLLTGVCLAEAAVTIARDDTLAHKLGGGMLTPAMLGEPYLERLQKAGLKTEIRSLP
ncbi:hypothetical protein LTR56_012625 [Elasticomyces elasticus]|nr:hypothetical protein LTR22_018500 [Elasticomyces elasticus]KAK3639265.1 hypothetical protein LTR56_012625 [Elasticomyces elasticus]KAK4912569.1 hypothetical protein LTR49_019036 [Elasticomyces elasticus]KAK5751890.1 hypothetical protein LTS12_017996 [Elasticomyces elasticus]